MELLKILKDDAALNMSANVENSAVAPGLERMSFHSHPKEGQCQRIFRLQQNCTHFMCQQSYAQNPSSQASVVYELRTSRCINWVYKRQRNQRSNSQHQLDHRESKGIPEENIYFGFIDYWKAFDCVDQSKLWKILRDGNTTSTYLFPEKPV